MPEIVILAPVNSPHARPIVEHFQERCLIEPVWTPATVLSHNPEMVITIDERVSRRAICIAAANREKIATLQVMDGILEWRNTWNYPTSESARPLNQPALAHKIACLGRADARVLESWGNVGKCEIVGSPRFDPLLNSGHSLRSTPVNHRPLRLLVMTARIPGFTTEQVEITCKSLADLRDTLNQRPDIQVVWRLTKNLHERLGVNNQLKDLQGADLYQQLEQVDAVISTSSTAVLEAMLFGHPVAVLDYHNVPKYVQSAWQISCSEQITPTLESLINPPLERMLYQEACLHDALACYSPAMPRMARLIEEMLRIRREQLAGGSSLKFPHRILVDPEEQVSWPSEAFDLGELYPQHAVFGNQDVIQMQAELEAARGTIELLHGQVAALTSRLHKIPGYTLAARLRKSLT